MKKSVLLVLMLGLALSIPGCGYDQAIDSSVTIVKVTPTPEATPTPAVPEATPTPAVPEATPTPEVVTEQSPSGVKIEKKDGTYYALTGVNLRADCSTDAEVVSAASIGTELKSTGVCENGWIRVEYEGQVCFVSGELVSTSAEDVPAVEETYTDDGSGE